MCNELETLALTRLPISEENKVLWDESGEEGGTVHEILLEEARGLDGELPEERRGAR